MTLIFFRVEKPTAVRTFNETFNAANCNKPEQTERTLDGVEERAG